MPRDTKVHVLMTENVVAADGMAFCGLILDGNVDWSGGTGGATCRPCLIQFLKSHNQLVHAALRDLEKIGG